MGFALLHPRYGVGIIGCACCVSLVVYPRKMTELDTLEKGQLLLK